MKRALLYALALATFGLGAAIVIANLKTLTPTLLIAAGACILAAYAMVFPGHLKAALAIVAPYLPKFAGPKS